MSSKEPERICYMCILYSESNSKAKKELSKHFVTLIKEGKLRVWSVEDIGPGQKRDEVISRNLHKAHIILCLLTPDFTASEMNYAYMYSALERQKSSGVRVIPVLVEETDWRRTVLGELQPLPRDGQPLAGRTRAKRIKALNQVVSEIERVIDECRA